MSSVGARVAILAAATLIVFGVVAAILLRLVPAPHRPTDYLVIGTASTLAALGALFAAIILGWLKMRDIFFRKRQKPSAGSRPGRMFT